MNKRITLHNQIYPIKAIQNSIMAFSSVCPILLTNINENEFSCDFDCKNDEYVEIRDEFCNYLIAVSNKSDNYA